MPASRPLISTTAGIKPKRPSKRFSRSLKKKNDQKEIFGLFASLYRKQKDYPKAIEAMERVIALDSKNDQAHFQLGALYDENKNKEKSIASMKKAIELNPQNAAALNYLGYTWAEMGVQLDEAESLIQRALKIEPNDGFYIDSLGWVYYQKGDYNQSRRAAGAGGGNHRGRPHHHRTSRRRL